MFPLSECNESLEVVRQSCVSTRRRPNPQRRLGTPLLMPGAAPPRLLLSLSAPLLRCFTAAVLLSTRLASRLAEPHTHKQAAGTVGVLADLVGAAVRMCVFFFHVYGLRSLSGAAPYPLQ